MQPWKLTLLCLVLFTVSACQEEAPSPAQQHESVAPQTTANQDTIAEAQPERPETLPPPGMAGMQPPQPPVFEDFQGTPQLRLFPWAGDFRPAENSAKLPTWQDAINQLVTNTGIAEDQTSGRRSWVFSGVDGFDSVGYLAPLAVSPETSYRISYSIKAQLAADATTGMDIREFNRFLWIPGQYNEEIFKRYFSGSHAGEQFSGTTNAERSYTFMTGPNTDMIHLILYRNGPADGNSVMFDDIRLEQEANQLE